MNFSQPTDGTTSYSIPHTPGKGTTYTDTRPKPYDRLSSDKPGEELAPDASVWQLYVEEAAEHDNELVKEKNNNLDVMLLFAALFSAILTAFLIESKDLLREDSSDLIVTLLLAIAQSQQRIEQGDPKTLPLIERPAHAASSSSRWINGLWFTALFLSLSAALIAMLAKEWLIAFTVGRSRSARMYAHLHQKRLEGLGKWGAINIMDLLPSMLHLSLLLFSLGLVLYLWILDSGIALIGVSITTIVLAFYGATTILAAIYESCPFVTQASKYLHTALRLCIRSQPNLNEEGASIGNDEPGEQLESDLKALLWLAKNASDPAISNCACQALAGLPATSDSSCSTLQTVHTSGHEDDAPRIALATCIGRVLRTPNEKLSLPSTYPSLSLYRCHKLMNELFDLNCGRIFRANNSQRRDLKACQGMNVARYSGALPALVQHLLIYSRPTPTEVKPRKKEAQILQRSFSQDAFDSLDEVWSDECPEFSADAYALLVSAELRLVDVITKHAYDHQIKPAVCHDLQPLARPLGSGDNLSNNPHQQLLGCSVVDMATDIIAPFYDILVRYSRATARLNVLLNLHVKGQTTIGQHALVHVLESMRIAAQNKVLNPPSRQSIVWPISAGADTLPWFWMNLIGIGSARHVSPLDAGDEDQSLSVIINLLASPGIESTPEVENRALHVLATIGPTFIRQWLGAMDRQSVSLQNKDIIHKVLSLWPGVSSERHVRDIAGYTAHHILCVATVALSQVGCQYMSRLAEVSISCLHRRINMQDGQAIAYLSGRDTTGDLFEMFIQMADLYSKSLSPEACNLCVRLFLVDSFGDNLLRKRKLPPQSLPALLHLLAETHGYTSTSELKFIFAELRYLLPSYLTNVSYLLAFMRHDSGFMALNKIAALPDYSIETHEFIAYVLEVAACRRVAYPGRQDSQLASDAAQALLSAVQLVIKHTEPRSKDCERLAACIKHLSTLLNSLNPHGFDFPSIYTFLESFNSDLQATCEKDLRLTAVWEEWKNLQDQLPVGGWHLVGIPEMFGTPGMVESGKQSTLDNVLL